MVKPAKSLPQKVVLVGNYCRLEPLDVAKHGDDLWLGVGKDDEIWTYMLSGPWQNKEQFLGWLNSWYSYSSKCYYAVLDKNNKALGALNLTDPDLSNASVEIGGIFFGKNLQKTTIASEAVFLLSRYAFEELSFRRLQWICNIKNIPSEKAARRFGFIFEGVLRNHKITKGQSRDTAVFSILDSEWPERKEEFESWLDAKNFDAEGKQIKRLEDFRN